MTGFIQISGGLFSTHFVAQMREESVGQAFTDPRTFRVPHQTDDTAPDGREFDLRVRSAWEEMKRRFDTYGPGLRTMDAADLRKYWLRPLFQELGFTLTYVKRPIEISERRSFVFPYRGWFPDPALPSPPVISLVPPSKGLDERTGERGVPSPHDYLQQYLNLSPDGWAILSNGLSLRILRDFHHTTVNGYVEFDLEAIFFRRAFEDFVALYRFCHASRFAPDPTDPEGTPFLEEYYAHSLQAGEQVGSRLRENVVLAIEALGNGFLDQSLLEELQGDEARCQRYYEALLAVVYRIIFMLFAEQRGMLGGSGPHADLYLKEYSITALRERAGRQEIHGDRHTDLWEGLRVTFRLLREGEPALGIYPFNGMLFDEATEGCLAGRRCRNEELLRAVRYLTWMEAEERGRRGVRRRSGGLQRISYSDLSVEEIGSIYESLLDYTPRVTRTAEVIEERVFAANAFILDPRGSARKSTASYYTHPSLIQALIESTLEPVLAARLAVAGDDPAAREEALLGIKVCDPACGSGAFLIAAGNRLGMELARIRSGEPVPAADVVQQAKRDVLAHCIYGVDLNPMAVELAKVSLWINALVRDQPLSFLDHHLAVGNSLVGATPELLAAGVPDTAFDPVAGDDRAVASAVKRANRAQRESRTLTSFDTWEASLCPAHFAALEAIAESDADGVHRKQERYAALRASEEYRAVRFLADLWTSAFFWPLDDPRGEVPTHGVFLEAAAGGAAAVSSAIRERVEALAAEHRFFHWHLAFPEVFARGGFDVVIGNPPWETLEFKEQEFFSFRNVEIAAATGNEREQLIGQLAEHDPRLHQLFKEEARKIASLTHFFQNSGHFPLTGRGKINTYTIFTELARSLVAPTGLAGVLVPTGIATDKTTSVFFSDLVISRQIASLYDFENRKKLFADVDSRYRFCLLTMTGVEIVPEALDFAFFLLDSDELNDQERRLTLTPEAIRKINPNTGNCPIFRHRRDAAIAAAVYKRVPVLVNETMGESGNPWGVRFKQGLFNMKTHSALFRKAADLENDGFTLDNMIFRRGEEAYLPLYESKMFHQYDHRFGTFTGVINRDVTHLPTPTDTEHENPNFQVVPWYWVSSENVRTRINGTPTWLSVFRDITNSTNERTGIFSFIPAVGVGHTAPIQYIQHSVCLSTLLIANQNSIVFDYFARQKVGGTHLTFFIVKQLAALPPDAYTPALIDLIAPRVVELAYTAHDLDGLATDILEEIGPVAWDRWFPANPLRNGRPVPFQWDDSRRALLRADIDGIYAHLYGLSREDLEYILSTFPRLCQNEEAAHGSFRTRDLTLEAYGAFAGVVEPYQGGTDGGSVEFGVDEEGVGVSE